MIYPNVKKGGVALPLGHNLFLMKGRKHKNGGIDIGKNLEVEGDEIMQTSPTEVKVFSAQKFLNGQSPAELVMQGANPNAVFNAQENYKDAHKINDDGTKKAKFGIVKKIINMLSGSPVKEYTPKPYAEKRIEKVYTTKPFDINDPEWRKRTGEFIRNAENPRRIGYDEKNKRWYAPTGEGYDKKNFGYGVDKKTAQPYLKLDEKGREYLTDDDMWMLHNNHLNTIFEKNIPDRLKYVKEYTGKDAMLDEDNAMRLASYIYRAGSSMAANTAFDDHYNQGLDKETGLPIDTVWKGFMDKVAKGDSIAISDTFDSFHRAMDKNETRNSTEKKFIRNEKQSQKSYGGMTKKENNAFILGYSPLTGVQKKACGGKKKANGGSDDDILNKRIIVDPGFIETSSPTIPEIKVNLPKERTAVDLKFVEDAFKDNSTNDNDYIDNGTALMNGIHWGTTGASALGTLLSGVIGARANAKSNEKYLTNMENLVNKMKAYDTPLTKLKTHYNINPQLSEINNAEGLARRDVDANTSSSQTALARKRAIRLNSILQKNKLHGQKENIETQLINQDKMQQAHTIAQNIRNQQAVEHAKLQALANLQDKRSENQTSKIHNIVGASNAALNTLLNGLNSYEQLLAGLSKNEHGTDATVGAIAKLLGLKSKNK